MSGNLPLHPSDEDRVVSDMTRDLERLAAASGASVGAASGFADRVMAAVAQEPLPQPVRAFGLALLGGHLRAAAAAVGDAWRTIARGSVPVMVRAQALALVLVVLVGSVAAAGGATAGALGLLAHPEPTPSSPVPSLIAPSREPDSSTEPTSDSPTESDEAGPSETDGPSETPDRSETPRPTDRPRTQQPTPTSTDDGGGSGSGGSGHTETPGPTETDDSSPGGDG